MVSLLLGIFHLLLFGFLCDIHDAFRCETELGARLEAPDRQVLVVHLDLGIVFLCQRQYLSEKLVPLEYDRLLGGDERAHPVSRFLCDSVHTEVRFQVETVEMRAPLPLHRHL